MTETYDWNPMPHTVAVKCPSCGYCALFEFAEVVKIKLKKDIPHFQESDLFDYQIFNDSYGHKWHGAAFYAGLHGGDVSAIRDLPDGYTSEDWAHSKYLYRDHGWEMGSIRCSKCFLLRKHKLSWPREAFFSLHYKQQQLWAFDRESGVALRDYIASSSRDVKDFKWRNFLLHVPSDFKPKKAREYVVKQLDRLLKGKAP
ncbi:MAG: hypothetical protein QNI92_02080 [Desulfobacterales bacterium]|nr:hypothetical protein [Desulfobacterales bacterium]